MDFTQKVYTIVSQIPCGRVASYGQIAMLAGKPRAARQVGFLLSRAPGHLKLPCHRVVRADGSLAPEGFFAHPGGQRALLEQEKIPFTPLGRVNMHISLWKPNQNKPTQQKREG